MEAQAAVGCELIPLADWCFFLTCQKAPSCESSTTPANLRMCCTLLDPQAPVQAAGCITFERENNCERTCKAGTSRL